MTDKARQEVRFEGAGVSAGIAHGKVHVVRDDLDDVPRYRITMASGLDEETCRRVNLGYVDYRTFEIKADVDTLIVENAGRDLYQPQIHADKT